MAKVCVPCRTSIEDPFPGAFDWVQTRPLCYRHAETPPPLNATRTSKPRCDGEIVFVALSSFDFWGSPWEFKFPFGSHAS